MNEDKKKVKRELKKKMKKIEVYIVRNMNIERIRHRERIKEQRSKNKEQK